MRCSIIIAVLESYEIVRRQMLYFSRWMHRYHDWEVIIVDDGSDPAIKICGDYGFRYNILQTNDTRPWTQPCARNIGANFARGEYLLMTDIDHILTEESVQALNNFTGDKMHFWREWGILDESGCVSTDLETLKEYGLKEEKVGRAGQHYNTFAIRKSIFCALGGYDPKFCGKYGGDDTDFSDRYAKLCYAGKAQRSIMNAAQIYVYPDPSRDVKRVFHGLRTKINAL